MSETTFPLRFAKDQRWVFSSPDLLNLPQYCEQSWLKAIPGDTQEHAISFTAPSSHRLGIYFEQLVVQTLEQSSIFRAVKANQQVIINKHTLGEFDVLLQEKKHSDNQLAPWAHLELATKFYLQIGAGNQLSDWVGPNLRDRFDDKFNRLIQHQLTLSTHEQVAKWLESNNIVVSEKALLCKGRLFYPWEKFERQEFCFPPQVCTEHLKGFWLTLQELRQQLEDSQTQWYVLPKSYWLAELDEKDSEPLVLLNVANYHEHCEPRLIQIAQCRDGVEIARGFVVTEDWLIDANLRVQQ